MTMLEESRAKRQAAIEIQMGDLSYERFRLGREIAAQEARIIEIDDALAALEGALKESESVRKDIDTSTVIEEAKAATAATETGGG